MKNNKHMTLQTLNFQHSIKTKQILADNSHLKNQFQQKQMNLMQREYKKGLASIQQKKLDQNKLLNSLEKYKNESFFKQLNHQQQLF